MTLLTIPALEAWDTARKNRAKRWPSPERGKDRLYPRPRPMISPSFTLDRSDSIYTIGSCFARNIEEELSAHGFTLPTLEIAAIPEDNATGRANGMLNKFVTGSMRMELEWALGNKEFSTEYFYRSGDKYVDLSLKPGMPPVSLNRAIDRRLEVIDNTKKISECNCVTITLGLIESWYDIELDYYLNCTPPYALVKEQPKRFEFRVLDFSEVYQDIYETIGLINVDSINKKKIILTVSPVPLDTTFSNSDVILSNTYSKSVLRSVASTIAQENTNIDYFPSYEIVTLADSEYAWGGGDYRHVNSKLVKHIVNILVENYVST